LSARLFLAGFAKSVLVHRHAFVPTRARTLEIGLSARLPASFDEAFGGAADPAVDAEIAAGRWGQALRRADAWAARAPRRPEPRVLAGVLRLWPASGARVRPGRLEGLIDRYAAPAGLRALERAAREFPEWAPGRLWLALALLRRTDLPAAWGELDALCAARPDWVWPVLVRSELGRVDVVYAGALRDLDAAERLEPRNAWVQAFRARVLFQMKPGAAAAAAMDRAAALAPRAGWIRGWRADARRKLGDLKGASADLKTALRLEPDYDRLYLWSGKVLRALGRPREAERVLTRGLRACPHFEKAYAERARARLDLGRVDAALRDLEKAVAVNHRHNAFFCWTAASDPLTPDRTRVLRLLAGHARARPRSARAWAWLGEALIQAGESAAGLVALDRALALNARRPRARTWRGEALLRLERLPEAERELDAAIRADPDDGRARAFRGRARFLRGRPAAAVADLEKAASDGMVEYSWIYHWRAQAKAAARDLAGARVDARTASSLEPGRAEFRALSARLAGAA
jgi:tetratricopeptide (TPR) repeat protein